MHTATFTFADGRTFTIRVQPRMGVWTWAVHTDAGERVARGVRRKPDSAMLAGFNELHTLVTYR